MYGNTNVYVCMYKAFYTYKNLKRIDIQISFRSNNVANGIN